MAQPRASRCFQPPESMRVRLAAIARPGRPCRAPTPSARRRFSAERRRCRCRSRCSPRPSGRRRARTSGSCSRCSARICSGCVATSKPATGAAPAVGVKHAAEHADGGRLARPVGAQEAEDLAACRRRARRDRRPRSRRTASPDSSDLDGESAALRLHEPAPALRISAMNTSSSDGSITLRSARPAPAPSATPALRSRRRIRAVSHRRTRR